MLKSRTSSVIILFLKSVTKPSNRAKIEKKEFKIISIFTFKNECIISWLVFEESKAKKIKKVEGRGGKKTSIDYLFHWNFISNLDVF
jgi:hypothetical protein